MKKLCFLFSLLAWYGFSTDCGSFIMNGHPATAKDSLRIDKLVGRIDTKTFGRKCDRTVLKKFFSDSLVDSGYVEIGYKGAEVLSLQAIEYHHQKTELFSAVFLNGSPAWFYGATVTMEYNGPDTDSLQELSVATQITCTDYFYKGAEIRKDVEMQTYTAATNENNVRKWKLYYFNQSGDIPNPEKTNQWIAFANSDKSHQDFFTGSGK